VTVGSRVRDGAAGTSGLRATPTAPLYSAPTFAAAAGPGLGRPGEYARRVPAAVSLPRRRTVTLYGVASWSAAEPNKALWDSHELAADVVPRLKPGNGAALMKTRGEVGLCPPETDRERQDYQVQSYVMSFVCY